MLLDTSLFPPDVEYTINPEYGETKTFRKQVRIHIGAELFAVVNSDYFEEKWLEPKFVIMRAVTPPHEIEELPDIAKNAQLIMSEIVTADKEAMEKLLKKL